MVKYPVLCRIFWHYAGKIAHNNIMRYARSVMRDLSDKLNQTAMMFERLRLREYLIYLNNPKKVFLRSFLTGVANGLGTAVGFTILGAIVIYILQQNFINNIPIIGDFVGKIMKIANETMKK